MDFYSLTGKMALGSRLRRLSERLTEQAQEVYRLYDIPLEPKWFPVFYMLSQQNSMTITEIATGIGHSHPSVSRIVREMTEAGLIAGQPDKEDARRNPVALTAEGMQIAEKIKDQYKDVERAIDILLDQADHNLWKAMEEWEYLLDQKNLLRRVEEARKEREGRQVRIVDYTSAYREAFRRLNEEWIRQYFRVEAADLKALDHPETYILEPGGHIVVAIDEKGEVLGVCAMIKMEHPRFDYELAKMAVSPAARGLGIGYQLGRAAIEWAGKRGARHIYLESNTVLTPAIRLYEKLGFRKVTGYPSPYERCNIQMEYII